MTTSGSTLSIDAELESHRRGLTGYCYRMLGSGSEAEDAVQETMVRAWRAADRLQSRAALKAWLYRIASNVCFDFLQSAQRRAQPMTLGPSADAGADLGDVLPERAWVLPVPDARVLPDGDDPAAVAASRETLRLAFVAALQHLPARQRAVLILREVLHWSAAEVAELLDTSAASVNSALQRARATLADLDLDEDGTGSGVADDGRDELLERYVEAFEAYDLDALAALLRDDVEFSMPPYPLWVEGPEQVVRFMSGTGAKCEGSRVLPTRANGAPAAAIYNPAGEGRWEPWAIVVLDVSAEGIAGLHHFLYPELFGAFGLPRVLEAEDAGEPDDVDERA